MAEIRRSGFLMPRHWTLAQRLEHYSKDDPSGCRLWTAFIAPNGYGRLWWKGANLSAHRAAWIAVNGPVAEGLCICHKCDVRSCVNVDHLFIGTYADNNADCGIKGRKNVAKGQIHYAAILTDELALEIFNAPGLHREIAARFGVKRRHVGHIKSKERWAHIHR